MTEMLDRLSDKPILITRSAAVHLLHERLCSNTTPSREEFQNS